MPEGFAANDTETVVFVIVNDKLAGYIALSDEIRPESAEAIKTLKENKIKSILLTGDNNKVAKAVSETLGLDSFFGEVLPDQKLDKIKELQTKGEFVAMTGDGVNDAPALAQADIGIAVGSGSDIAAETAGIVLVNSNPKDIVSLILFGKATYRKMIQNLIWATGYNVVALPLAAGVLYKQGILLSPAMGAVLMTVSTIVVAINASLLKVKNGSGEKNKDEEHPEVTSDVNSETKGAATSEAVDKPKPEVKDESKDKEEPEPKASAEVKPEIKEEPVSKKVDKPKPEVKDESKNKVEPGHEANADAKPEGEVEPKVEGTAEMPSSLTPEIVNRVHKLYEELGREEVKAVQEWEETQKEQPASKTGAEQKPKGE